MENKRTEAKSSYHVGGMSIVFVQLVLSVLFLVLARENGMIPGKYLVPIGAGRSSRSFCAITEIQFPRSHMRFAIPLLLFPLPCR